MFWDLILGLLMPFAPSASEAWHARFASPAHEVAVVDSISVEGFSPQRTPFHVSFGDHQIGHRVMAMFVLPNQTVPVAVQGEFAPNDQRFEFSGGVGRAWTAGANRWMWTAPEKPGVYPIEIGEHGSRQRMTINVFVMVPNSAMRNGSLNGYRIGRYPAKRTGFEANYAPPVGFVEVTPELEAVAVSPHFTLGQFVCKQQGSPRYLVLRPDLLVKLEEMLAMLNDRGVEANTFSISSAYRTPFYNRAIGNETSFSRHHYGDAADIIVDEDGDHRMDDINRDGRHSFADARVLEGIVAEMNRSVRFASLVGGLGTYAPTHGHGGFVHVDVRGFDVRWGA